MFLNEAVDIRSPVAEARSIRFVDIPVIDDDDSRAVFDDLVNLVSLEIAVFVGIIHVEVPEVAPASGHEIDGRRVRDSDHPIRGKGVREDGIAKAREFFSGFRVYGDRDPVESLEESTLVIFASGDGASRFFGPSVTEVNPD